MMKKIFITLRNNLLILVGLTLGLDVLLDVLEIQPPFILVMIWVGFLLILSIWGGVVFAKKTKKALNPRQLFFF
tara:strand:+ start:213 stop:434 length:222 start_codon:yes stop_codon:yes gene_type:complete